MLVLMYLIIFNVLFLTFVDTDVNACAMQCAIKESRWSGKVSMECSQ